MPGRAEEGLTVVTDDAVIVMEPLPDSTPEEVEIVRLGFEQLSYGNGFTVHRGAAVDPLAASIDAGSLGGALAGDRRGALAQGSIGVANELAASATTRPDIDVFGTQQAIADIVSSERQAVVSAAARSASNRAASERQKLIEERDALVAEYEAAELAAQQDFDRRRAATEISRFNRGIQENVDRIQFALEENQRQLNLNLDRIDLSRRSLEIVEGAAQRNNSLSALRTQGGINSAVGRSPLGDFVRQVNAEEEAERAAQRRIQDEQVDLQEREASERAIARQVELGRRLEAENNAHNDAILDHIVNQREADRASSAQTQLQAAVSGLESQYQATVSRERELLAGAQAGLAQQQGGDPISRTVIGGAGAAVNSLSSGGTTVGDVVNNVASRYGGGGSGLYQ